jgi:hypothetical protein
MISMGAKIRAAPLPPKGVLARLQRPAYIHGFLRSMLFQNVEECNERLSAIEKRVRKSLHLFKLEALKYLGKARQCTCQYPLGQGS